MAQSLGGAAKAASDEAKGKTKIFTWFYEIEVEGDDGEITVEKRQLDLKIPRKFKRLKFASLLAKGDFMAGLAIIFKPDVIEELEEIEMDSDEFEMFMERLGEAIGGTNVKN